MKCIVCQCRLFLVWCIGLFVPCMVWGMVYDSRILPLYQKMVYRQAGSAGQMVLQPLMFVGDNAFLEGPSADEVDVQTLFKSDIPLWQYEGNYNERVLARAATAAGKASDTLIGPALATGSPLIWDMEGVIRGQGLGLTYWQPITSLWSWGFDFFIARVTSTLALNQDPMSFADIEPGDRQELFTANVALQQAIGVQSVLSQAVGMSDINMYVRLGGVTNYRFRMRHMDAGMQLGVIIPTSNRVALGNPASISLGGSSGRWGIFIAGQGQFELKQGLTIQALLRLNKRFSLQQLQRVPVLREPDNFGVDVGLFHINPGLTVAAQIGIELAQLRSGLGLSVAYLLAAHQHDRLVPVGQFTAAPNTDLAQKRSAWACEYVTAAVCYDMGADSRPHVYQPIIRFNVDIPVHLLIAHTNVQTYGISLTIESTLW